MSGYIEFSDGTMGLVGDDGWVDEFDAVEVPVVETATPALSVAFIDIDAASVVDTELPERTAFVGPPRPIGLPVELVERVADAMREWGER
ncbi:hypothetical protein AB0L63_10800 [Nocardia sp. NPDC051990]|uniref:hypothetical protein n=1 Tax=Nocardia sp. NPDC051990 TaxID=3155285 RepID=UPI00342846C2